MPQLELVSIGRMALLVGVMDAQLRKLCDRSPEKVPHNKLGLVRVFDVRDVEEIKRACRDAGYLRNPEPAAAAACPV